MADGALVPEIRFKGFAEPWEQRRLGDIANLKHGYPFSSKTYDKSGNYNIITISNVNGKRYISLPDSTNRICIKPYDLADHQLLKPMDILVSLTGNVGRVSYNQGDSNLLNQRVGVIDINHKSRVSSEFVFQVVSSSAFEKSMIEKGQGAAQLNISRSDIEDYEVTLPLQPEQEAIGLLFEQLDSLITLQQCKCDKLRLVKESMLEKMFPKPGCDVPEVRFGGFIDPWEQRRLGEVATRVTRKNENLESTLPLTISAQYGLVDQTHYFNNQVASRDLSGYYLLKRGEFAYNKSTSSDNPWGAVKKLDNYEKGCVSTLYITFATQDIDSAFLVTHYETDRWHKGIQMIAAEGARNHGLLNVAPDDFFQTTLTIPSSIEEQQAIGLFFAQIDNLITLYQRKLEALKKMKSAMLSKMFV